MIPRESVRSTTVNEIRPINQSVFIKVGDGGPATAGVVSPRCAAGTRYAGKHAVHITTREMKIYVPSVEPVTLSPEVTKTQEA